MASNGTDPLPFQMKHGASGDFTRPWSYNYGLTV